jgi:hypothetical protein
MSILRKPSAWEVVYSIAMALARMISYTMMTELSGANPFGDMPYSPRSVDERVKPELFG